jgi:hypothetical protein
MAPKTPKPQLVRQNRFNICFIIKINIINYKNGYKTLDEAKTFTDNTRASGPDDNN